MKIPLFVLLLIAYKTNCYYDDSDVSSDDSSDDYEDDDDDYSILARNIFVNKNTNLSVTIVTNDNTEITESRVNNGAEQTMYTNGVWGVRIVLPKEPRDVCLVHKLSENTRLTTQNVGKEISPQILVTTTVKKCLYRIVPTSQTRSYIRHICQDRHIVVLDLIKCYTVSSKDITLDNRKSNVKRRAICIPLWESYRVEATCVATVYPIFIHKLCYTKTEYFSRTFCFNGTFK